MYRSVTVRRAAVLVRVGWGVVLFTAPGQVLAAFGHRRERPAVMMLRVLGVRQVAQAVVTALVPSRLVVGGGAVIDGVHALTGAGLAVASPGWRRIAATDAAVAAGLGGVGWRLAEQRCSRAGVTSSDGPAA